MAGRGLEVLGLCSARILFLLQDRADETRVCGKMYERSWSVQSDRLLRFANRCSAMGVLSFRTIFLCWFAIVNAASPCI